jgi:hypothetical protein
MTKNKSRARSGSKARQRDVDRLDVVDRAKQQLTREYPCAYYFKDLDLKFSHGVLTVQGSVPTDTLRSLLETILSQIDGVEEIDDQVDVISSTGLSSVHPECSPEVELPYGRDKCAGIGLEHQQGAIGKSQH